MPPTEKQSNYSAAEDIEDEESETWPQYVLAGIGIVIGVIILGVLIWILIKCIKKRKRKSVENEESTVVETSLNSTVIQIEDETENNVESSVISAENNSQIEDEGKTKPAENVKEKSPKSQSSTTKSQQSPAPPTLLPSKAKTETPKKKEDKQPKEIEAPKKFAVTPKKTEAVAAFVVPKTASGEKDHQEPSSKLEDVNVSKDCSKESAEVVGAKKETKVVNAVVDEKNKDAKVVKRPENSTKEKKKEVGKVGIHSVSTEEEEDLKKNKKEDKREKLKKQFNEKAEKKKQKKQKNNKKLKPFDSKESWSDPPNSTNIYVKTVKPELPLFVTRTELPSPAATKGASIWSVLRHSVGKDLSRVTVPIHFNEPLSYLQRLAEYMEYISLIREATTTSDPVKRLELISAFALSNVSSNNVRLSKPFNPLLHETYELSKPEFGYKFIAEQVSHHPPISAFHSEGDEFEFYGNVEPKIKFWGRSLEDNPQAFFTLILKSHNETYTWKAASFSLHNLIMGKMYISLTGCVVVKCAENNLHTKIKFRGTGKQSGGADTMFLGEVIEGKKQIRTIYGNWTQYIASTPYEKFVDFKIQWEKEYRIVEKHKNFDLITLFPESRLLWRIHEKPSNSKEYYNLPYFSLALNEMLSDSSNLPKTDVRFRPDIRQMEEGNLDLASHEKERLEEKQRTTAKEKEGPPEPHWFSIGIDKGSQRSDAYIFNGKYWSREFSHCEDIY